MSTQHTPTPWIAIDSAKDRSRIEGIDGRNIADLQAAFVLNQDQMRADAAFIVRACNAHDELVADRDSARASLTETAKRLRDLRESHDGARCASMMVRSANPSKVLRIVGNLARAALAKAGEA